MSRRRTTAAVLALLLASGLLAAAGEAAVPRLAFPVVAKTTYTNDFGAPRAQGRHEGNDLMAAKRSPVVAVETGRVAKWTSSRSAGCMLYLHGRSGATYLYVHLNNDRTRRNDNRGGCRNGVAYAPGLTKSQAVEAGELLGFVGDSGDADGIAAHLHFELRPKGGRAVSPYRRLRKARRLLYPRPPASVETLGMQIRGRVVSTRPDLDPRRMTIRVSRVRLSNGWVVRPGRNLTVAVPADAVVRRDGGEGSSEAATLADFSPGSRVAVGVAPFEQTLAAARARAGAHAARTLVLKQ